MVWLGQGRAKSILVGGRERTPGLRRVESVLLVGSLLVLVLLVFWMVTAIF